MPDPIPYFTLPDEWANKARCPVCNTSPLVVFHRAEAPDQMACPRRHSLFVIEQKGTRIQFAALPGVLMSLLTGRWVTYAEVKQSVQAVIARQAAESPPVPPEPSPFTEEMVTTAILAPQVEIKPEAAVPRVQAPLIFQARAPEIKDIRTRARDLYALGNSPEQIKEILSRDISLDKTEIQFVVDHLYGQITAKKSRQRTWMWVSIGTGLGILMVCITLAFTWQSLLGKLTGGTGMNIVATLSANKTIAPLMATPIVVRETPNGAARAACPQTKEQASALFGGPASSWYADTNDGSWFLVTRLPVAVHVPGGMNAVLVNIGGGGVNTVPGPSSILNATSLTILCR